MELKDFVKETLLQITQGVKEAQKAVAEYGAVVNPEQRDYDVNNTSTAVIKDRRRLVQIIDFEVGLTAANEEKTKKGVGVMLGSFGAGGNISKAGNNTSATNIKFKIPVVLPSADNQNSPPKSQIGVKNYKP